MMGKYLKYLVFLLLMGSGCVTYGMEEIEEWIETEIEIEIEEEIDIEHMTLYVFQGTEYTSQKIKHHGDKMIQKRCPGMDKDTRYGGLHEFEEFKP